MKYDVVTGNMTTHGKVFKCWSGVQKFGFKVFFENKANILYAPQYFGKSNTKQRFLSSRRKDVFTLHAV